MMPIVPDGLVCNPDVDYVLFFKALSFALLSLKCLMMRGEKDARLPWGYLAGFGFFHAVKDINALMTQIHWAGIAIPDVATLWRVLYLLCLLEFGREGMRRRGVRVPPRHALLLALAGVWAWCLVTRQPFSHAIHYSIGIPGALLAAATLFPIGPPIPGRWPLRFAAAGFAVYAILMIASKGTALSLSSHQLLQFRWGAIPIGMVQGVVIALTASALWVSFQQSHEGAHSKAGKRYGVLFSTAFLGLYAGIAVAGYGITTYLGNFERRCLDLEIRSQPGNAKDPNSRIYASSLAALGKALPFRPNDGAEYVLFGHVWRAGVAPVGKGGENGLVLVPAERIWKQRFIGILFTFGLFILTFAVYEATRRLLSVSRRTARSERRFGSLFEHVPEAAFVLDESTWRIIEANPNAVSMLGYDCSELESLRFTDLLTEATTTLAENVRAALAVGTVVNGELVCVRKDGLHVSVEIVGAQIQHSDRDAVLLLARDITDRLSWEENLKTVWESAQETSRMKSEFLANMSHEIRTPMNGVLGMLDLVLGTDVTATQRDYLNMAKSSAEDLLSLINNILDISKIEAGRMELESVPFEIGEWVRSALEPLIPTALEKGIRLNVEVAPDVPPTLSGDPVRLRQVLMNLVGNAVKFTPSGSVTVTVVSEAVAADMVSLRIAVADTGIGVPKDRQEAIFQAFTQVDSSISRQFGGTGLGLNISCRLVRLMGGKLTIESIEGKGSTFRFDAALSLPPKVVESAHPVLPHDPSGEPRLRALSILVVEDNGINRIVAQKILERIGQSPVLVTDGAEAIDRFSRDPFDVVLMDIQMPGMDGVETTRLMRLIDSDRGRRTPVIALTAHALAGDRERFLAAGMDGYLSKPLRQVELIAEIRRLVPLNPPAHGGSAPIRRKRIAGFPGSVGEGIPATDLAVALLSIRDAVGASDAAALEREAHSLKELAEKAGMDSVEGDAFRIVMAARKDGFAAAGRLLDRIESNVNLNL